MIISMDDIFSKTIDDLIETDFDAKLLNPVVPKKPVPVVVEEAPKKPVPVVVEDAPKYSNAVVPYKVPEQKQKEEKLEEFKTPETVKIDIVDLEPDKTVYNDYFSEATSSCKFSSDHGCEIHLRASDCMRDNCPSYYFNRNKFGSELLWSM
jgi:hypothetical protein